MGKDQSQKPKKKKEKIVYIDDGSTIADMSALGRRPGSSPGKSPSRPAAPIHGGRQKREPATRAGRIWQTYTDAVRAMIGPMLVAVGAISVLFLLLWVILGFFA